MIRIHYLIIPVILLNTGCFTKSNIQTIESLSDRPLELEAPDPKPVSRDHAIGGYEAFLTIAKPGNLHSDALRRLADLKMEASESNNISLENRAILQSQEELGTAISLYKSYLRNYPGNNDNELILYQLSKAYSLSGDTENALDTMQQLVKRFPDTRYMDEIQFRIGEIYFTDNDYLLSGQAYQVIVDHHKNSIFYEKARYKYAWSLFKQNDYTAAVDNFIKLLKHINLSANIVDDHLAESLARAEKELITDTLRVICIALTYQNGSDSLITYITRHNAYDFEALLFRQLGDLYLSKDRILDAANTYIMYTKRHPENAISANFHTSAINAYKQGNFASLVLDAKASFANQYRIGGKFWNTQNETSQAHLRPLLAVHTLDLARHYHATAKKSRSASDYSLAASWYRTYLKDFSAADNAAHINFLLAESSFDAHDYRSAIKEYEITSYNYPPHINSAEAGYAALLAYNKLYNELETEQKKQWKLSSLQSALRFTETYPMDKRSPTVLGNTAEEYYALNEFNKSSLVADKLLKSTKDRKLLITAYTMHAHSQFELKQYNQAERSYDRLLSLLSIKSKDHKLITDKLAACIYKQGEQHQAKGEPLLAAQQFLRLARVTPFSTLRPTAEYDAATIYIQQKQWVQSIKLLEQFRRQYPDKTRLQQGVTEKLALAYTETGNHSQAANELITLANTSNDSKYKNELLLQAADHYQKASNNKQAIKIYISIVKSNIEPFVTKIELQNTIASYYKTSKQTKEWHYWLNEIVTSNNNAGKERSDNSNLLAANAELILAQPRLDAYKRVKLNIPLKKSLKKKKTLMEDVIKAYEHIIQYQLAETSTAATYNIGETYKYFANALIDSQRPTNLSADELEQYEILLEEQAYPFEEKAISIHEANIKQTQNGFYDDWIKRSLKTLSEILPVRYAKQERIDSYVDVIY